MSKWSEELQENTHRVTVQINIEDAMKADEIFSDLMGDNVDARREFINTNARYVMNLDI